MAILSFFTSLPVAAFLAAISPSLSAQSPAEKVERGHGLFYQHACWKCHTLGDEEQPGFPDVLNTGPDLNDVGSRLDKKAIRQSILEPNAALAEPASDHTDAAGKSKMPSFKETLPAEDLDLIVLFLSERAEPSPSKGKVVEVNQENFDREVKAAKGLVLLDFWAEWCLPCLALDPVLDEAALLYKDRVKIGKINVDQNPELVAEYVPDNIFPCLTLMKDGRVLDRKYGVAPRMEPLDFFRQWLSPYLPDDANLPKREAGGATELEKNEPRRTAQ